eukprot:3820207-Amphidinium_carterae.1
MSGDRNEHMRAKVDHESHGLSGNIRKPIDCTFIRLSVGPSGGWETDTCDAANDEVAGQVFALLQSVELEQLVV